LALISIARRLTHNSLAAARDEAESRAIAAGRRLSQGVKAFLESEAAFTGQ